MKVYYTASIRLNTKNTALLDLMQEAARSNGFKFDSVYSKFKEVTEHSQLSDEEAFVVFRKAQKSLKNSDVVIADVSHPSDRIGFEVATAIADRKPVLAILNESAKLAPPIQGNKSKYLKIERYKSDSEVPDLISKFLKESKKMVDTKFILIISPEIDKYLEWAGSERRMHKAQIVRNAVEDAMAKDKEYTQFLKELDKDLEPAA